MKKIISMLLVLAMMITVLTVGIATTSAADTATITIYGLDGTTNVKEVNVGDEFTVYTTLNASAQIGSVQGTQTYTSDVLTLVDKVTGQYGEFEDLVKVFPITGEATMANGAQAGKIVYNASTPSTDSGFAFNTDHSLLIVTTYKVAKAGSAEVKNALKNLAAADSNLTKIVYEGEVQSGKTVAGKATFDDPTPAIDHAEVRIRNLDGSVETKSFNIGDTFVVYTTLDASSVNDGKIASVNGVQKYTSSILQLTDAAFPVMGDKAIANTEVAGSVKYAGSNPSTTNPFLFNSNNAQLIDTTYKVVANGYADITNKLNVLAAADEDITKIVYNGETQSGMSYSMPASFNADAPIPTQPQPTTPAPTTPQPTDPPASTLKVTIVNPDNTTSVKEFSKGASFTVYTVLNAGTTIASVDGTQTYPTASLQLTDEVDAADYNSIVNLSAMFPILGDQAVASAQNGAIKFNASRAGVGKGYAFNSATSKLIVTNYKVLATGTATIKTTLKTLIKDDAAATKIVFNGTTQSGQSYSMTGTFTDPGNPVQPTNPAPTEPQPTTPATEPPVTDKATVTIYGIDGTSKTKTFNIGDEFTVYTTFDASQVLGQGFHGFGSISATQTFTDSVLQSTDEVDELQAVVDTEAMFPIIGANATAKIADGLNKYNASTPGVNKGYVFADANALLAVTHYKVIAAGNAEVRNALTTVAADNAALTRIVNKGVVADGYTLGGIASFTAPGEPEPTEPPATEPPATEPPATEPPATEPPVQKATVTIYGIDGTSATKEYSVGDTFTVYTTFDASSAATNGMIASISASQTFTSSVLKATDAVDSDGVVTNVAAMFPVLGEKAVARITNGLNKYNASTPNVGNGFQFKNNALLIVTNYKVLKAGNAEVRNTLTTVAAADENLTRIVDKGVVASGKTIGGIASFTAPDQPVTVKYLVGDSDDNDSVESIDATYIQRFLGHLSTGALDVDVLQRNGDVDRNGDIEIIDATMIQRYLAHLSHPGCPIGEYLDA